MSDPTLASPREARAGAPENAQPDARPSERLGRAVHRAGALTKAGLLERLFTWLFTGLVYPQIWEDPEADLKALRLGPDKRLMAIASGGCNLMSYLTADPKQVIAVDLSAAHVALVRLKLAAAQHLPNHAAFHRFFGLAEHPDNPVLYDRFLRQHLDTQTRAYWDRRDWLLRRRVNVFKWGLYRRGLLGRFIGAGHFAAWLFGVRLKEMLWTRDMDEQRVYFDREIAPLFDKPLVRWMTRQKASLFGLGIPPAQYDALATDGDGDMALVLKRRLEKLCCDFPLSSNYFAWQAFARRYATGDGGPAPLYLQNRHFQAVGQRAERVSVENRSFTERLGQEADGSLDAYVLLDAQDWMTDAQLTDLWSEITRTAKPGARVVFRTAAAPSLLPGQVEDAILDRWSYETDLSQTLLAEDRSAIYGGVHVYTFNGRAP